MNTTELRQPTHREELERELVHGAASQIAHAPENAAAIAKGIKTVLDELAPVAQHPVAIAPLPALDPGPDSMERAMESKTYQDGTTAFGPAPLPDVSPALWAKPLAKEVPELTVSLSDLGLEREIQAKGLTAPRVTPFEVEAHIRSEFYFTAEQGVLGESELGTRPASWTNLDQVTICVLILTNGTKIVGVNEGPVSRENFKADLGRQYARQKAVDQIWPLLGFRLRDELARPVLTEGDVAADAAGTCRPDNHTSACTACKRA